MNTGINWAAELNSDNSLTPLLLTHDPQVGCPNERPRYYCLATLEHSLPQGVYMPEMYAKAQYFKAQQSIQRAPSFRREEFRTAGCF
jgi:hypothetical protein